MLPAILGLGVLSLGILGLRAQNSAPPTIAVSRHALNNNGRIEGSAQQLLGEDLSLNGSTFFGGDLRVPGNPRVQINGRPNWRGQSSGGGSSSPSNYSVNINGNATLGYLVKQSDPIALDAVAAPPNSRGTRSVNVNNARDVAAIGAWNTVRDLNFNGGAPDISVPAGTYGNFNVNGGALVLGTPNDNSPDVYNFQNLSFNGQSQLKVVGPVVVTVRNGLNVGSVWGSSQNQAWLQLNISNGGTNINSGAAIYGAVRAPNGSVNVNGVVWGSVQADRLTINNGGSIKLATIVQPTPIPTVTPAPTATPTPTALPVPTPTGAPLATVSPILECVENLGNGQYRAHFGTNVPGTQAQIIPVGTTAGNENKFAPAPIDRDQPTSFLPGRTVDSFQVVFNGSNLTWTLRGRAVTASVNSNGCPIPTPTPTVAPTATPVPLPTATPVPTPTPTAVPTPTPFPNRAPVAVDDAYAVDEDGVLDVQTPGILSNDSDADGDNFEAQLVANPTHGTLELQLNGGFKYTPAANFNGADSFTYRANDGALNSNVATVSISVNPVNDAPVAADVDGGNIDRNATLNGTLRATDVDDNAAALTFSLVQTPAHGEATVGANGTFTYRVTPGTFYSGPDSFTYRATDAGGLGSNVATVRVTVTAPPAPIARDDDYSTNDNIPSTGAGFVGTSVLANDSGDGPLTALRQTYAAHGYLTLHDDGTFNYYPNQGFVGDDSFTYSAVSAQGAVSNVATVTIHVVHANRAPYAATDFYSVGASGLLNVSAPGVLNNDTDPDIISYGDRYGDKLTAALLPTGAGAPRQTQTLRYGTLEFNADGSFVYRVNSPLPSQITFDSFDYSVSDGQGAQTFGTAVIRILPTAHAPVAQSQTVIARGSYSPSFNLNGSSPDGISISYELVSLPTQGTLRSASGAPLQIGRVYNPNGIFYESTPGPIGSKAPKDSFLFRVRDDRDLVSENATVTIRLAFVNSAPVAVDDTTTTTGGAITIPVLANDTDADGDALRVYYVDGSGLRAGATVTIAPDGQSVIYNPGPRFDAGSEESFTYRMADGIGELVTGRVTVRQVRPGGGDGSIISYSSPSSYFGNGVINLDANGQIASGYTSSPSSNYPGAAAYSLTLRNVGSSPDSFVLRGPAFEPGATAQTAHWSVRYFTGDSSSTANLDITDQVTSAAGWTSPNTDNGGATRKVRVEVRPDATVASGATLQTLFDIRSLRDENSRDVVGAISTKGAATPNG